jgi:WD40 repeat protein
MARICRYCPAIAIAIEFFTGAFFAPTLAQDQVPNAGTDLYDRPTLAVDPGMHTAAIWGQAVDDNGEYAVTGGHDRTVRIWSVASGKLLRTIWIPVGPEPVGEISAVAISPDGSIIAAGGFTERITGETVTYLFARESGTLTKRISGLPEVVQFLAFSPDGRFLAATLGADGIRVFDRDKDWNEAFRDEAYALQSYGASFASDGRLATTSLDGTIRLYRYQPAAPDPNFRLAHVPVAAPSGHSPYRIAFSPDGKRLAVGYVDLVAVDVLDATTLDRVGGHKPADLQTPDAGSAKVAWSSDGGTLFATGAVRDAQGQALLLAWDRGGLGTERRMTYCAQDTAADVSALPHGRILVASLAPCLSVMDASGQTVWTVGSPLADFRGQELKASVDGNLVDFVLGDPTKAGVSPNDPKLRLDLHSLTLSSPPPRDGMTFAPNREGSLPESVPLRTNDSLRSIAITADTKRFFLGSSFALTAFDITGMEKWRREAGGEVWTVNASRDGRVVVAAEGDGTVRWYRADDGRELLALQVLPNKKDWVLWTPEGFYEATDGAQDVLKWVTNHGPDHEATAIPVSRVSRLHRPDALRFVIDELNIKGALGAADLAGARLAVQAVTGSAKPPGAVLHVLAIGVDQFGLQYAADDARGVVEALSDTQKIAAGKASLYADVTSATLVDEGASRITILEAVDDVTRTMRKSVDDQDVAVILFSGHGEMIENKYYLIPYGVDTSTPTKMETSSVWIEEFAAKIKVLAQRGRVLLLFDACHSGAVGPGGESPVLDAGVLRDALNSNNITVLTSSDKDEESREDPAWKHGAFTKAFLDALAGGADLSSRGVISTGELAVAMRKEVGELSGGKQRLGMHMNFADDVFVTGQ